MLFVDGIAVQHFILRGSGRARRFRRGRTLWPNSTGRLHLAPFDQVGYGGSKDRIDLLASWKLVRR